MLTKAQIFQAIADGAVGVDKKTVVAVLSSLTTVAIRELNTSGEFVIPGIVRLKAKETPATPERQGTNPFTKQPTTIKAKPASLKVKAFPVASFKTGVGTK